MDSEEDQIFTYLSTLTDYPNESVRSRVTTHIANQDAKTFPNKLADVHQELINLEAATGKSTTFGNSSIHSLKLGDGTTIDVIDNGSGSLTLGNINSVTLNQRLKNNDQIRNKNNSNKGRRDKVDKSQENDPKFFTKKYIKRAIEKKRCSEEDALKDLICFTCGTKGDHVQRDCEKYKKFFDDNKMNSIKAGKKRAESDDESDDDENAEVNRQYVSLLNGYKKSRAGDHYINMLGAALGQQ